MKFDHPRFVLKGMVLVSLIMLVGLPTLSNAASAQEKILNKDDADYIFSLTREEWEAYAKKMVHPQGWELRLSPHTTGTGVMAYDSQSGMGLAIQPLYGDYTNPPDMLIVSSFYPLGTLPNFTDEFKKSLEKEAMKDLGPHFSVSASYVKMSRLEGVRLKVTKKDK